MFDTAGINAQIDIIAYAGELKKSGAYHIGGCPLCGGSDRFSVKSAENVQLWHCRECNKEKYADGISFLMRLNNASFTDICKLYSVTNGFKTISKRVTPKPRQSKPRGKRNAPPQEWQNCLLDHLLVCHERLMSDAPKAVKAREYLHSRGITGESMHRFLIGYNPQWVTTPHGKIAPKIIIPAIGQTLNYIKSKTFSRTGAKYICVAGGLNNSAMFNSYAMEHANTAVIVEGEFDAILLSQFVGDGVAVVTMGGASGQIRQVDRARLAMMQRVYICLDNDKAGQAALAKWKAINPELKTLPTLPNGANDITDYWKVAGNDKIREWIAPLISGY